MERIRFRAHAYQERAIRWVIEHPRCLLFLDMGLGKSVITLTAVQELMTHGEVGKVLVIAPKKVAESTWSTEAEKWSHLDLRVSVILGDRKKREAALMADADVYVTSRDTVVWLQTHCAFNGGWPFDMIVLDELTSFKNPRAQRFKSLRRETVKASRVVGLTGTPTPNGLVDLWAQVYCVDNGERLGRFVTKYRERWFDTVVRNNIVIKIWPKPGAEDEIRGLIEDITLTMRAEDWLRLPEKIERRVDVRLPDGVAARYRKFERESVMETLAEAGGDPRRVTAASAAALANKLSQFANGAVYDDERNVGEIHAEKLEALEEIVESAGGPVLVFYQFQHDRDRILARLKGMRPRVYEGDGDLRDWNEGKISVLLAHPASTAYGLNMQQGGNVIVWFSTGWNLELYQQANARLHRQGQRRAVMVYRLVTAGTVDERMDEALRGKDERQRQLLELLKI